MSLANAQRQKRGPTVLVTDSREQPWNKAPSRPSVLQRQSTRLITVDNVLQYASDIPSGQRRGPPRPVNHARTPSGRHPLDPKLSGRTVQQHVPQRSSKLSEKLVLIPETDELEDDKGEFAIDNDAAPPKDGEAESRKQPTNLKEKSYAERLPKASRTEKLSRVTAYCTAQSYRMPATAEFLRTKHGARTKMYDDCLYTVYHLPLLPGHEGYRIRSSPVLKSPGGKAVLDEELERSERYEYQEGYFGDDQYGVRGSEAQDREGRIRRGSVVEGEVDRFRENAIEEDEEEHGRNDNPHGDDDISNSDTRHLQIESPPFDLRATSPSATSHLLASSISNFAEMFIFSYGVVVFWNFTERQEKDILADLTFSSSSAHGSTTARILPLAVRPQLEEDFETEEFHFEYNPEIPRPRVFNDMITLRSADHMIKLTMSHAIAQSTKLSFFEERMTETMSEAQYVPRRLALQGELGMTREEVVKMLGRLFLSRVDVNLSSNVLDVPNFFWDSEPTLHPLYIAVREYLEIKPRIQVLNERCRVFLDLAEILSDSINDRKMSRITWIIIFLIILSILVTVSEVFLRFGILAKSGGKGVKAGILMAIRRAVL